MLGEPIGGPVRYATGANQPRPVTADVQRELAADVLDELASVLHGQGCGEVCVCVDDARALLPTVQDLIADAEKRAAARELRAAASDLAEVPGNPYPLVVTEFLNGRADALDPT